MEKPKVYIARVSTSVRGATRLREEAYSLHASTAKRWARQLGKSYGMEHIQLPRKIKLNTRYSAVDAGVKIIIEVKTAPLRS